MKKILRNSVLVAGAAAAMIVPSTPASAASAAVFTGTAVVGCFGCGVSSVGNSASLWVTGVANTAVVGPAVQGVTPANGSAAFTVNEPVGATCVVSGTATGTLTVAGAGTSGFNWTRTGAVAVVTTDWGTAVALFAVTSPVGNPCGGRVEAQFAGALVGV